MDKGAVIEFDIDGPAPGTGYDRANIGKNIFIGDASLDLVESDFTPSDGEAFFILNNEGNNPISGQFTNAPEGSIITSNGYSFMITYSADADTGSLTGGNDVALIAVPEPAAHVLALSAAVLLAARFSRRKSCRGKIALNPLYSNECKSLSRD